MAELGALSLRLQETGGQAVLDRLQAIDKQGGDTSAALQQVAGSLKGIGTATPKVAGAVTTITKWTGTQKELSKEVAEGTRLFALQARTVDLGSKTAVKELRSSAAAQREWLKAVGASTTEQLRFGAAVQTFEKRVAAAEGAQARQTQRTRQQSQATQVLSGTLTKANGEITSFGKAGLRAVNGLAFAFSQMAADGEASLRSLAGQATSVLSLMGKSGAVASIVSTIALSVTDVFAATRKRAIEKEAIDRSAAIKAALTTQKAFLQREETTQKLAYEEGLRSLSAFYDRRQEIIQARTRAEATAREQEAANLEQKATAITSGPVLDLLPDVLKTERLAQADELRANARVLRAEAKAARDQGAAEEAQNQMERLAAEKQLAAQIRGFEQQRLEAQDRTHQARLIAIQQEATEYNRALERQGVAEAERLAKVQAFRDAMTAQAHLQQTQVDIALLQQQLETERARIQQDVVQGKVSEREGAERVAAAERSALPTLREMVQRALQFAAALGDQGALTALRQLEVELGNLGVNTQALALQQQIASAIGTGLASGIAQAFEVAIASGSIEEGFAAMGRTWLAALGSLLIEIGTKGILANKLMMTLAGFLGTPAGLAAAVGLVALGGVLRGMASRSGGGGGATGGGTTGTTGTSVSARDEPTRLFVQGARASQAQALGQQRVAPAPAPVVVNLHTVNPADPATQRLLSQAVRRGAARGY